jgi:hypothetical protein
MIIRRTLLATIGASALAVGCIGTLTMSFAPGATASHPSVYVSRSQNKLKVVWDLTRVALSENDGAGFHHLWSMTRPRRWTAPTAPLQVMLGYVPDTSWQEEGHVPVPLPPRCFLAVAVDGGASRGYLLFTVDSAGHLHRKNSCSAKEDAAW